MWKRKELKRLGKAAFKANYWRCVLVALIIALIAGGFGAAGGAGGASKIKEAVNEQSYGNVTSGEYTQEFLDNIMSENDITTDEELSAYLENFGIDLDAIEAGGTTGGKIDMTVIKAILPFIIVGGLVAFAIAFVISVFLINPLDVGCQRFFAENSKEPAKLGELAYGFENGYGRTVKTMLLRDIFIILWSLLFIIPGIIKTYSYRMVPYILAEEPELEGRAAINRSREMMKGNKWRAFVLDLSFILWYLLTLITLGIVGIFYVNPYVQTTNAELYHAIKN